MICKYLFIAFNFVCISLIKLKLRKLARSIHSKLSFMLLKWLQFSHISPPECPNLRHSMYSQYISYHHFICIRSSCRGPFSPQQNGARSTFTTTQRPQQTDPPVPCIVATRALAYSADTMQASVPRTRIRNATASQRQTPRKKQMGLSPTQMADVQSKPASAPETCRVSFPASRYGSKTPRPSCSALRRGTTDAF